MTNDELDDIIDASVAEPQQYSADGQSVQSRPILDLLEAQRIIATRAAAKSGAIGWDAVRVTRGVPAGMRRHGSRRRWVDFPPWE